MRPYIALLIVGICFAQSQPPSPTSREDAHGKQTNRTARDEHIATKDEQPKNGVVIVNQYNPAPNDRDKREQASEHDKSTVKEWIDTISTVLLAGSTIMLFLATVALGIIAYFQWRTMQGHHAALTNMAAHMESGLAETVKAASAARDSAETANRTFVASHRPRLEVRFMSDNGIAQIKAITGRFILCNIGDTRATLIRGYSEVIPLPFDRDRLPAATPYERQPGAAFIDIELLPGNSTPVTFPTIAPKKPEPSDAREHDLETRGNIYVIGWIDYTDDTGIVHRKGFARRYYRDTKRFERVNDQDYEYDD